MTTIVTLDQAKQQLNIDADDTTNDAELSDYIDALAGPVEAYLHEVIVPRQFEEDLELCGHWKFWLNNSPVISLSSLASLDGVVTWDVTNFKVRSSGLVRVITGPNPNGVVTATYQAGYASIPDNIQQGALVMLQHVWETQRGAGGVVSGVVGDEEIHGRALFPFTIPNKAKEWFGDPTTLAR